MMSNDLHKKKRKKINNIIYSFVGCLLWWASLFTLGIFQTLLWTFIITLIIGIWLKSNERF